jgi:succinoglycan biosynthesis transport protein ExoP
MSAQSVPPLLFDADGRPVAPSASRRRWPVFAGVFGLALALGLAFTLLRPAVYRSAATLLVEPPANPGRPLATLTPDAALALLAPTTSSAQLLATEQQRLLAAPLLQQVADEFAAGLADVDDAASPLATLQAMVAVEFDAATSLIDVALEGPAPDLQQRVLERWLEHYQATRVVSTTQVRDADDASLREQLAALDGRIAEQRARIDGFRETHGIVSEARDDNRDAAKLKGLNDSINVAEDEEMRAAGRLAAVQRALEAGEPVSQDKDRAAIERLEERIAALRDQVRAQGDKYTEKFAAIAPEITAARKDLAQAEADLEAMKAQADADVLSQAQTGLAAAREAKSALVQQQAALRTRLTSFNRRFEELEALRGELAALEAQAAPLRERLVRSEVAAGELAPRVSVLAAPATPARPVRPAYLRDAGLALAASFVFAWLATLFYEFLTRAPGASQPPADLQPRIYSMNTQLFPPPGTPALPSGVPLPALPAMAPQALLAAPPARELSPAEVAALLAAGDDTARLAIALVLLGLTGDELVALRVDDLAADAQLRVGRPPRALALPSNIAALAARGVAGRSADSALFGGVVATGAPFSVADLQGTLTWVAHDAGLSRPGEVTVETLRHTCFAWLVRQGLRLGELPRVGGALAPSVIASYAVFAPPGAGLSLEQIPRVYPALATVA